VYWIFFHVLLGALDDPVKVPPKKAGAWIFSTATVPGVKEPLRIAALPAASPVPVVDGKRRPAYLVIYCQAGAERSWNAFVDLRDEKEWPLAAVARVNGKEFGRIELKELIPGKRQRLLLPRGVVRVLGEAVSMEVAVEGTVMNFVLLHWEGIRTQLSEACGGR
jgi:hypothetical protein